VRFVPIKTTEQQTALMLHRTRQLLVRQRTMLSNALRGHLAELGIVSAKGRNGTAELLRIIADGEDGRVSPAVCGILDVLARTAPATSIPCTWNTDFAISRPIVLTSPMDGSPQSGLL